MCSIPALDHNADVVDEPESCKEPRRKRGKQPGTKGYGRKRRENLPAEEVVHDLPEDQRRCPRCGKPFGVFPGTEDSEQIEWEVNLSRRTHKRARYVPTCHCRAVTGIVTAPGPPKLIPKGMFATSFWVRLLMEKFGTFSRGHSTGFARYWPSKDFVFLRAPSPGGCGASRHPDLPL